MIAPMANQLSSAFFCLVLSIIAAPLFAQGSGYRLPAEEIVDVLDAPPTPGVDFAPDGSKYLLVERPAMPSIAEVAAPWEGLAGMRIDPSLRARRSLSFATALSVVDHTSGTTTPVQLPEGARIAEWQWSPDGGRLALLLAEEEGLALFLADPTSGASQQVAVGLNGVLGAPFGFVGEGQRLWVRLVPKDQRAPTASKVPTAPAVQETLRSTAPLRTYQDLLSDPASEDRFEHLATTQLAWLDPQSGALTTLGAPALFGSVNPSPDGQYVLVERMQRPFSYVLPAGAFPRTVAVWDRSGKQVLEVARMPMGDNIPMQGVPTGPRNVTWRATAPATLVWVEAQDGGDPAKPAELRDIWYARAAPFAEPAVELAKLEHRARGLQWLSNSERFLVGEYDRDRRWTRLWLGSLDGSAPILVEDRSQNDRYGDPGSLLTERNGFGESVVRERDGHVLRAGPGHSPAGPRPFLARVALESGARDVLWQSREGRYESFAELLHEDTNSVALVFTSESATEPANYWKYASGSEAPVALTQFEDPTPQLRGITQEILRYERADGVPLSGTLYLPADYEPGTRLPLVVWAYPREFNDPATAGQVTSTTDRALRMRGPTHLAFLLAGYAVLDNATMPVVGDPETMNETFIEQIVASAQAAVDACVARGVADADHAVVGGHSYGAFMTAHLLAHSDIFRAGLARSGAYNRSLTPFGFQSERRTLWEAPESYIKLSPFFSAHRINEPLLLTHGEMDSNSGTFPMQSERLYAAVKGNGGTARLVMLPAEDHGYQARESVLHTVAEMIDWCERFVRPAPATLPAEAHPAEASSAR